MRKPQIPLLLAMVFVHGVVGDALAQPSATATAGLWGAAVQAVRGPVANVDRIDLAPLQAPMRVDSVARHAGLDNRGIYSWYADARARSILRQAGLSVRDDGLAYVGKAASFRQRVLGKHINGSVQNSTLRKTLRGVLIATDSQATPADVSRFMRTHLKVAMLSIDDAALIDSVERTLIETQKPALNVNGNPNAARVKELRKLSVAGSVVSARIAIATMAKGAVLGVFVEAPLALTVETLHVVNGRKTVEEAAWDATQTVGLVGLAGGAAAGVLMAATGLGLTISAPVAVPLAVVGGGAFLWMSSVRVLGALDDETREAAEAQLASVQSGIEERVQPISDGADAVIGAARDQIETVFTALGWTGAGSQG